MSHPLLVPSHLPEGEFKPRDATKSFSLVLYASDPIHQGKEILNHYKKGAAEHSDNHFKPLCSFFHHLVNVDAVFPFDSRAIPNQVTSQRAANEKEEF